MRAIIAALFLAVALLASPAFSTEPAPAPVDTTVNLNSCAKCVWSIKFQQFRCKWCWLKPVQDSTTAAFTQ